MAAYRRVYDSHYLQADYQEPSDQHATLCTRVWATFYGLLWSPAVSCGFQADPLAYLLP